MNLDLTANEVRVLGALVEKELSTPDYYPMTLNALAAACNQKTNREPVMSLSETDVVDALASLQKRRLAALVASARSRSDKYRHLLPEAYDLSEPEVAVLCSLMLRGLETVGEIRARASRMHAFDTLEEVERVLGGLAEREPPLVAEIEPESGRRDPRYAHLLSGVPELPQSPAPSASGGDRLDRLEDEVRTLREELDDLRASFEQFRGEFE